MTPLAVNFLLLVLVVRTNLVLALHCTALGVMKPYHDRTTTSTDGNLSDEVLVIQTTRFFLAIRVPVYDQC